MKVYAGNWRRFGTALMLALATACAGCGSGGDDALSVNFGDTVVFVLRWEAPDSIDLSVRLPNGRVIAFDNLSEAGCVLVPVGPPTGPAIPPTSTGTLEETVTCTAVGLGTYQAFANSNEPVDVAAELEITAPGQGESFSFNVPANGQTGPFKVEVET